MYLKEIGLNTLRKDEGHNAAMVGNTDKHNKDKLSEYVARFKYLGMIVTNRNNIQEEIKCRMLAAVYSLRLASQMFGSSK
jgi:hypothetical protein